MKRNDKAQKKHRGKKGSSGPKVSGIYSDTEQMKKQINKQLQGQGDHTATEALSSLNPTQISSVLFEQYRALGYYSSGLPLSIVKSDNDILIASSVGDHAFYVYDSAHLNLAYMSKFIADKITCIESTADGFVYTSL